MRVLTISASVVLLGVGTGACKSKTPSSMPAETAGMQAIDMQTGAIGGAGASGGPGQAGQGAAAVAGGGAAGQSLAADMAGQGPAAGGGGLATAGSGGTPMACADAGMTSGLGIASVKLSAAPPVKLTETVQLMGDGLDLTLMPQQNVTGGLRWRGDRMYLTADQGFWDIDSQGGATWKAANSTIVWGIRAGDLDGDGDQDLIVLTMQVNTMPPPDGGAPMPFVSKLTAWERTPAGLMQRADVMTTTESRIGMPYALGDLDKDGDLDVIGFDNGAPVGFINGGDFKFSPAVLAESAPELADKGAIVMDLADRNGDGSPDLLIVAGNLNDAQAENSMFVMLGDGKGKFKAPGPLTAGRTPLVPYGPDGSGVGMADVTGDGLVDVLMQSAEAGESDPVVRVYPSMDATTVGPAMELKALGFEFADVDEDGKTDIVTTVNGRLSALLSRAGTFEMRDLGVSIAMPQVKDFVVDPGAGMAPATVHVLYNLESCPACGAGCSGRCLFGMCVGCLSDGDCMTGRCEAQACVP